jgi:hypothetical protein
MYMKRGTKSSARAGETTKPPTSSMTYGWRVDGGAPRQAGYAGRVCSPMTKYMQHMIAGPRHL